MKKVFALVLTLAVLLAMTRPATTRRCVMNAGALALMAIVFGIGEIRDNTVYLQGVVSRKKQMVPALAQLWG